MEAIFILLVVVAVAVVIPVVITYNKKTNEAWASAARKLRLRFTPAAFGQRRRMEGEHRGMRVTVDTYTQSHGKSSTTYTRFRVGYPQPLGLDLNLTPEGLFSGLKKAFGSQDIETGDKTFDDAVLVKGRNTRRVVEFLTPARRVRVSRFLKSHKGATIRDDEIRWKRTGLIRTPDGIVAVVQRITDLARCLTGEREEDEAIERAMEAQNEGRLADALAIVAAGAPSPPPLPGAHENATPAPLEFEPIEEESARVEEKVLEGEILYLAGKPEEARAAFEAAQALDPEDEEVRQWIERFTVESMTSSEAPAIEVRPVEAPPLETSPLGDRPAPEPEPTIPPSADDLDVESVCAALFLGGGSSFDASRIFDDRFQEKRVRWSGVLAEVTKYTYDFVFGSNAGTKATIEIGETESSAYGTKKILAILQLPEGAEEELKDRIGETLAFTGVLKKADGFMRNVFVAEGRLE